MPTVPYATMAPSATTAPSSAVPTTPYTPGSGSATSCPNPPFKIGDNLAQNGKNAATLMQSLNLGGCQTATRSASGSNKSLGYSFFGGISGSMSDWQSKSRTTSGCENINLLAQHYSNTVNSVFCAIQETSINSTTTINNINSIEIQAGPWSTINFNCGAGGFQVIQGETMDIKIVDTQNMDKKTTDSINHSITDGITNWAKAAKDQALQGGSDPDKTNAQINTIQENLSTGTFDNESMTDLQSMSEGIKTGNTFSITTKEGATININGDKCVLSQNVILNIAIENAVSNAFTRALQGVDIPTLFPPPPNIQKYKAQFWAMVIGGIILLILAIAYVYFFIIKKRKAKQLAFRFY